MPVVPIGPRPNPNDTDVATFGFILDPNLFWTLMLETLLVPPTTFESACVAIQAICRSNSNLCDETNVPNLWERVCTILGWHTYRISSIAWKNWFAYLCKSLLAVHRNIHSGIHTTITDETVRMKIATRLKTHKIILAGIQRVSTFGGHWIVPKREACYRVLCMLMEWSPPVDSITWEDWFNVVVHVHHTFNDITEHSFYQEQFKAGGVFAHATLTYDAHLTRATDDLLQPLSRVHDTELTSYMMCRAMQLVDLANDQSDTTAFHFFVRPRVTSWRGYLNGMLRVFGETMRTYIDGSARTNFAQLHPIFKANYVFCLFIVQHYGLNIVEVPDKFKTSELCHIAVTSRPTAFLHVPDRAKTSELCQYACSKQGDLIHAVPISLITFDLFVTAISCPDTLIDIYDFDEDVQDVLEPLWAKWSEDNIIVGKTVVSNPYAVRLLDDDWGSTIEYSDIWLLAITHGLDRLEGFEHTRLGDTGHTFYQRAVSINGLLLRDVESKDHTLLLYLMAVTQNGDALDYVKTDSITGNELAGVTLAANNQLAAVTLAANNHLSV